MSELDIERDAAAVDRRAATETAPDEPAAVAAEAVDLEDSWLYFNRELSWMDFNDRVLQLAEDTSLPLLERAQVLRDLREQPRRVLHGAGRRGPRQDRRVADRGRRRRDLSVEVLAALRERAIAQRERIEQCLGGELLPALAEHGIRIISYAEATAEELAEIDELFDSRVFPALTPLVFGVGRPSPTSRTSR